MWGARFANVGWHVILIFLSYKWPLVFSDVHSPLLVLSYLLNMLQASGAKFSQVGLVNNVIGFTFYLIVGLITSSRWIYTTISMLLITIGTCVFYGYMINLTETTSIMNFIVQTVLACYSVYQNESKGKSEFIQMEQIKKMNGDLKNILINFPEGIVLYDESKHEVVLANQELRRIFKCNSNAP